MATREDFLAQIRSNPEFAGASDNDLLDAFSFKDGFDPSWLPAAQPVAAVIPPAPVDTSFSSALLSGTAQPVAAIGESARVVGEVSGVETLSDVGDFLAKAKGFIPQGYKSASEEFTKTWDLSLLPRAITEQSGQLLGSIASRLVGGAIGGLVTGAAASPTVVGAAPAAIGGVAIGQAVGPALFEALQLVGSVARERAKNDGRSEVSREDLIAAMGTSAVSGTLNSIGDRYLGGKGATFIKRLKESMLGEGITEGAQSVVEQLGGSVATEAGAQVSLNQAAAEGVLGAGSAGVFTTAMEPFAPPSPPEIVKQERVAPKPEKAQAEFSFDVPPPTVDQTVFVAPADVWDDSVGGFVGASFVGRTQAEADAKREEAGLKPVANMTPEERVVYVAAIRAKQPVQVADATAKTPELVAKLRGFGISNAKISQLDTVSAVEVAKAADAAIAKVVADRELESEAYQQRLSANVQTRLAMAKQLAVEGDRVAADEADKAAAVAKVDEMMGMLPPPRPSLEMGQRKSAKAVNEALGILGEKMPVIKLAGTKKAAAAIGAEQQTGLTPGEIASSVGVAPTAPDKQVADINPQKVSATSPAPEVPVTPPAAPTEKEPVVGGFPNPAPVEKTEEVVESKETPAVKFTPSPAGVFINSVATAPIADLKTGAKSTKTESIVAVEYEVPDMPGVRVLVPVYTPRGADGVRVITQTESRSAFIKLVKEVSARTLGGWLTSSPDNQKKANALLAAVGYDRHNGKSTPSELAADRGWTLTGKVATLNQPLTAGMYTDLKMGAAPTAPVVVSSVTQDKAPAAEDLSDILKKLEKKFGMVSAKGERKKVAPAKPKSALDSQLDKITSNPRTLREFTGVGSAADALGFLATQPDVMTGSAATAMVRTALVAQAQVTGDVTAVDAFDDASANSPESTDKSSLEKVYFSLLRAFASETAQEARKADETKKLENNSLLKEAEDQFGSRKFRELSEQESRELSSTKVQESIVRDAQLAKQMTAYGLDVTAAQMAGAHAATYYKGLISVIADYTTLPSGTTFNSMLHEFGHFVWEKASPATQLALQRGAAELAKRVQGRTDIDRRVGKGSYAEYLAGDPGVPLTEARWAEEVVVETAMLNGVERPEAASLWRALWREMKTALLNSAMWLENLMTGQVNTETAQAWMDNHIAAVIAGDRLRWVSYLNNFNVRPTLGRFVRGHMTPGREWLAEVYNGGTVEYHNISGLSPDAVSAAMKAKFAQLRQSLAQSGIWNREQNVADVNELFGEQVADANGTDIRKRELAASAQQAIGIARSRIAAANEMRKPLFALLEAIKKNQVPLTPEVRASAKARGEFVPEPITDIAQLSKMLGVADPEVTALKAREQLKASLLEFGVDVKEVPASLIAGTTKLTDLTLQPDIDMSYSELNKAVGSAKALTINKMEAARERTAKLVLDVERLNKKLAKFSRNPLDAMAHIENLFDTLRTDIAELAASSRRVDQAGDAVSEVEATMASLYGAQELAADKSKMTDTLVEKALGEKVAFFPILGELFQLEADGVIDLANDPATKIRDAIFARAASEPDSALNDIVIKTKENRLRGTAFLSALITYTKRNAMETDMMRAAILKKEGDLAAVTRLQSILREANDAKLDEIRAELARKNTRLPSERLIQRVLNARDDLNRKKIALAIAERDAAVLRSARETFDLLNGRIEDELTITGEYVHHNGAKFVVAKSADMSLNDLFGKDNLRTLVTKGAEKITEAELRQIIADNGVWLEANKNKDLGIRYQQMLMQQKVMQKALHGGAATELMYGLGEVRLTSFARQLTGTGTEAGRRLASMMNEISLFSNRFAKKDSVMGDKWEKAMDVLRKASGIADYQEFRKTVYDPLGQHLDSIMDDFDGALARFERTLSPEMMARPGFKQALRELAVSVAEEAKYQNEKQKAGGPVTSLVLDPTVEVSDPYDPEGKTKTTQLRRQIDRGAVTFPQTTAQAIRNWVSSRDQKFSQNSHLGNPFSSDRKIFEKLIGSKADTATAMKMFLGDNGWEIFMKPLLTNIRGFVPRPIGPDGAVVAINPTTAEVFAAGSNENLDTFIEKAYAHYLDQHRDAIAQRDTEIAAAQRERDAGGVVEIPEPLVMETPEAYRSRVLDFVGRVWRELDTSINDRSKPNSLNQLVGFQNIGIDARASATWPTEWKSPQHFGTEDNRSATRSIATTAAIGRNGQDAAALINDLIADIAKQKSVLAAKVPGETEDDQIEAKLKGDDRKKFKALRAYEKINWVGTLVDSLKNEKGLADDNKALMEAWSSYVVVMVSGLTNSLKNFISPSNFMTLEGEVSRESIADVGGAYADAGKQLLGSVAQTLGIDLFKDDNIINAVLAEGYGDPATDKRTADLLVGGRGVRGNLGKTAHAFRTLTNIYKDSRIGASFGGRFPALRLLNPFAFTQVLVTLAAQVRLVKVYSQITDRMVDFYKTGGNPAKVLTAGDLGFKANRFDNLTLKAKLSGARDLQLIAQETMAARNTNPDYIHPDLVHLAARLASDKISVEGSLASNHPFFSRSRGGKMAGTLLGWPIRQTWEYMDSFSDPRNKKSNQAWLRGAKLVVLGALPTALLFSALLDEWDEITGKPKAKTSIWRAENPEQFFRGLMDAFVDTGVLGIATDVPALVVNSTMASVNKGPLLSLDNRVVAVSVAQKFLSYLQQMAAVGPQGMMSDYMGSRGLDAIGLGTPMRNADVLNNLTGGVLSEIPLVGGVLEDVESQRLRTGANNVIRAAAADLKLQLKTFGGSMGAMSPSTPHVYDMVWAGLQDDQAGFDKALARALKAETDQGKSPMAARDAVKSKYKSRDPWSNVLKDPPTPLQIQEMYKRMGERRKYVDYAIKQFNEYGARIGVQSTRGSSRPSESARKWTNERPDKQGWFFGN